jgi:hypothetical protein
LIGAFFGRTTDRQVKSEIVVLITTYIISPEEQMIYEAKSDMVERAQESHRDKRTSFEKLLVDEKMFDKVQGRGEDDSIQIMKRGQAPPSLDEDESNKVTED